MTSAALRRWRARHGLSQQQAAYLLDVTQPTYSRWECGGPITKWVAKAVRRCTDEGINAAATPMALPRPNVRKHCEVCRRKIARYVAPAQLKQWPGRFCNRTCAGKWRRGKNHHQWRGGRKIHQGYALIYANGHPDADSHGYVREHRLVMERMLGRRLRGGESVHHKNHDRLDNRPENLQLFANESEHQRHHSAKKRLARKSGP